MQIEEKRREGMLLNSVLRCTWLESANTNASLLVFVFTSIQQTIIYL